MRVILISVAGIRPHLDEVRVEPYVFPAVMTFPGAEGEDDTTHTFNSPEELNQFLEDVGLQGYVTDVGETEETKAQCRYFLYDYDEESIVGGASLAETFGSAAEAAESIEPQMTNVMIKRFEL